MRVTFKRALAVLAFAACWAACLPGFVRAQTQLDWNAPPGCPDEAEVERAIERALDPSIKRHSKLEVEAEVERSSSGYSLLLSVQTQSGTSRERLEASDCALLVRVIALKVSRDDSSNAKLMVFEVANP